MEKTAIGIIGVGGISQSQHLPNAVRIPEINLKYVCDLDKEKLLGMQEKYKVPNACVDYREILDDPEIKGVLIATKAEAHPSLTKAALKAGKHVYVEKPLAETVEECREVEAVREESGKHVLLGFNRRFAPAYQRAKEIINQHGGASSIYYRISDALWKSLKLNLREPGTRILHEICHIFDILRWFTDSDASDIYCVAARLDDEIITIRFKSGCVATILSNAFSSTDTPKERLEVFVKDVGSVMVEEFVELRTFGFPECEAVERFPGHNHPDREYSYKWMLEKEGAPFLYTLRRTYWELQQRLEDEDDNGPDKKEIEKYFAEKSHYGNYMIDKGWIPALKSLATCAETGLMSEDAAGVEDGVKANEMCEAAIKSRETGNVIRL